jgi:hypothetical protein
MKIHVACGILVLMLGLTMAIQNKQAAVGAVYYGSPEDS